MSDESESLDLSALDLRPSWVTDLEKPSTQRRSEKPADGGSQPGGKQKPDRGKGRPRKDFDDRRGGGGYRGRDDRQGRSGKGRDDFRRGPKGRGRGDHRSDRDHDRREPPVDSIPDVEVVVKPAPEAVKALATHIRSTGRAYAMADVARMVLQARDRYRIEFRRKKEAAEKNSPFYLCKADRSLWLSREEAIAHILRSPALKKFYTVEEIEIDPPKGAFSVIAVCGLSGRILGPPNHHEYQQNLNRLHRERFSGMPFERFKSRIEMHRDEETIEKWKEQVSRKRVYRVGPEPETEPPETVKEPEGDTDPKPAKPEEGSEAAPEEAENSLDSSAQDGQESDGEESTATVEDSPALSEETEPVDDPAAELEPEADAEPETEVESGVEAEEDNIETSEEPPGIENATEEETDPGSESGAADEGDSAETENAEEAPEVETLNSEEELKRHFLDHHADRAIRTVWSAVVAGDVPGCDLSRPLLSKLKSEVDRTRKGFPLPMIQQLCRAFEKEGLRFFKRGKKTLYVSVTRPRPIANEEAFTDRIRQIVAFVREHPRARVVQMLDALCPGYQAPAGGESFAQHQLTQAEHDVLADLRWLTMEGYVIEFPNSELMLGGSESSDPGEGARNPKGSRPPKKKKSRRRRNQPRPNPLKAAATQKAPKPSPETNEASPPVDNRPVRPVDNRPADETAAEISAPGETKPEATPADDKEKAGESPVEETPAESEALSEPEADDGDPSQETSVTS